jgi:hypothetical protein
VAEAGVEASQNQLQWARRGISGVRQRDAEKMIEQYLKAITPTATTRATLVQGFIDRVHEHFRNIRLQYCAQYGLTIYLKNLPPAPDAIDYSDPFYDS